jgi:hypothetical protein
MATANADALKQRLAPSSFFGRCALSRDAELAGGIEPDRAQLTFR